MQKNVDYFGVIFKFQLFDFWKKKSFYFRVVYARFAPQPLFDWPERNKISEQIYREINKKIQTLTLRLREEVPSLFGN